MNNEPNFQDPPHAKGDAPCHWCGAVWVPDGHSLNSSTMVHADSCAYIAWTNTPEEG